MKRTLLVALLLVSFAVPRASAAPVATPAANPVRIGQVYGGGGATSGSPAYKCDYVELFNVASIAVSLTGWSVQYASASGTSWNVDAFTGAVTIQGNSYLLIKESCGALGADLPAADQTGALLMSATNGKIALVSNVTAITGKTAPDVVDFVGYGTANDFEGSAAAPGLDGTKADLRAGGGCTDTDQNGSDFTAGTPNPRNSQTTGITCSAGDTAPTVSSTTPANLAANVAINAAVGVTFSEGVAFSGTINIVCTSGTQAVTPTGGPTIWTLPHSDFTAGDSCSVTIFAAQVTDTDVIDPPDNMAANYTWSFSTPNPAACGSAADLIHAIQGSGATSPVVGQTKTIEGVVVADYQNTAGGEMGGFFVQEEDADADANAATSEGIYVYDSANAVAVGDKVRVTGTVAEYIATGGTPAYTLRVTELFPVSSTTVCSSGNSVTPATVHLPVANVTDLEAFEGMLVTIPEALTVADNYTLGRYGEVGLAQGGPLYQFTHLNAPSVAGNTAYLATIARRSIYLDDASTTQNRDPITYPAPGLSAGNTLRAGDTLPAGISGVLDQRFDLYRIQPTGVINWTHSNARPATAPAVGGTLRVSGVNTLNYFTTLTTAGSVCGPTGGQDCRGANSTQEFTRQQDKLVQELKGLNADVIGLMEIENASTDTPLLTLRDALNTAIGGTPYEIIATGPLGGDAIRVGLLYRKANVTPVGAFQTNTGATFSRPPLAQTFQDHSTGEKFSVVVNHFKSKGCGDASGADLDQGDGQGCYSAKRVAQATLLLSFISRTVIPNSGDDPDVLIVGDLNAYAKEDPITTLEGGGYTDLVNKYRGAEGYSYLFDGQVGYLDHALASTSLTTQVTGAGEWHINADEPISLDYNTDFKSAGQIGSLYAADPYRATDHDPTIIGLDLTSFPSPSVPTSTPEMPIASPTPPGGTQPDGSAIGLPAGVATLLIALAVIVAIWLVRR